MFETEWSWLLLGVMVFWAVGAYQRLQGLQRSC